jgi:hypothetical protein
MPDTKQYFILGSYIPAIYYIYSSNDFLGTYTKAAVIAVLVGGILVYYTTHMNDRKASPEEVKAERERYISERMPRSNSQLQSEKEPVMKYPQPKPVNTLVDKADKILSSGKSEDEIFGGFDGPRQ